VEDSGDLDGRQRRKNAHCGPSPRQPDAVADRHVRAYQRRTLAADALIASSYLADTNTRRVRRALVVLFDGTVGKDTVSRTWRKVKSDWDAWSENGSGRGNANASATLLLISMPPGRCY